MTELAEGQTRRGTRRNVMDFGAFVDLGRPSMVCCT